MRAILELFGKSPFRPLAEHAERVRDAVVLIRPLFEAFVDGDWARTEEVYERISKLEHKADLIKNDIRDHLPRSLFLPVDRGDVLLFLRQQDRIADAAEDLGVLLTMRPTATPPELREDVLALVDAVLRCADTWFETVHELPDLQESGFAGPIVERVMDRIRAISDLEWEADKLQASLSREMFRHEAELGAVSVIFWANILRVVGVVANKAESTADHLRLMLAKR
jgi:predicted phosphate transport protein (TIGR00153 family)